MFLLISGGHIGGPKRYTNMAPPYGFQFIFLLRDNENDL